MMITLPVLIPEEPTTQNHTGLILMQIMTTIYSSAKKVVVCTSTETTALLHQLHGQFYIGNQARFSLPWTVVIGGVMVEVAADDLETGIDRSSW